MENVIIYGHPLMCLEAIRTPNDVEKFWGFVRDVCDKQKLSIHHPLRVSLMQLSMAELEWNDTLRQHAALNIQPSLIAHINLSTEPLFGRPIVETAPDYLIRLFKQLVKQLNGEAWMIYSDWVAEEIERELSRFHPEASEEYQLQARLEDFLHENRSTLLKDVRLNLQNALSEEYSIIERGDNTALKSKEKEIILCRDSLLSLLDVQRELLQLIYEGVEKIEGLHPELISLKVMALSLAQLMSHETSWSRKILFTQLLDTQLGVVSVISGGKDDGRVALVFALRSALVEMIQRYPIERIVELCFEWDEGNRGEGTAEELRRLVVEHSLISKENEESKEHLLDSDINGEWVTFIPEKIALKVKDTHREIVVLVRDTETKKLVGCTREGFRLLHKLGFH